MNEIYNELCGISCWLEKIYGVLSVDSKHFHDVNAKRDAILIEQESRNKFMFEVVKLQMGEEMDDKIKKIQKTNEKEGKQLKGLLKADKKQDKKLAKLKKK